MKLTQLIALVADSKQADWSLVPCQLAPSYRFALSLENSQLAVSSHPTTAVYREDISVTLAYGLVTCTDVKSWVLQQFAFVNANKASGSSHILDIFYQGSLVYRYPYLWVKMLDVYLPLLQEQEKWIRQHDFQLMRLLNELDGKSGEKYQQTVQRAGFYVEKL